MYLNFIALIIGRILFGISTGGMYCIIPKWIEETVPNDKLGKFITIFRINASLGTFVAFMWGEYLPSDKNTWELEHTNKWRVIYFYFPASLYLLILISLLFILK